MDGQEVWLPIAWAPGYEVSNHGRVKSLDRIVNAQGNLPGGKKSRKPHARRRQGKILSIGIGRYASAGVAGRTYLVHRLVAEAFIGPCPPGHIVCHGPGGPLDNRLENISYGTHSKNTGADRRRDGTIPRGSQSGSSKLKEGQVIEIKKRLAAGESRASLGREFRVRAENISHIALGRSWGWLEVPA